MHVCLVGAATVWLTTRTVNIIDLAQIQLTLTYVLLGGATLCNVHFLQRLFDTLDQRNALSLCALFALYDGTEDFAILAAVRADG
jgi:hypothetical protein